MFSTGSLVRSDRDWWPPHFRHRNTRQLAMASKLLFPIPEGGLGDRLYGIRAKAVIVWGESDQMVPPARGEAFPCGIIGAKLVRAPAGGHIVIVEKPEPVVGAIARLD
jgi:pimeloyl-ACP methyl ester carboxylesterase